jgi:hypothetical protein
MVISLIQLFVHERPGPIFEALVLVGVLKDRSEFAPVCRSRQIQIAARMTKTKLLQTGGERCRSRFVESDSENLHAGTE